jgi:hypothetical protein
MLFCRVITRTPVISKTEAISKPSQLSQRGVEKLLISPERSIIRLQLTRLL